MGRLVIPPLRQFPWQELLSLALLMFAVLGWLGVTLIFLAQPVPPLSLKAQPSNLADLTSFLGHLLLFFGLGVLTALAGMAAAGSRKSTLLLGCALAAGLLWGAFTEWLQLGIAGRSGNLGDVLTDALGAVIGGLAAWLALAALARSRGGLFK